LINFELNAPNQLLYNPRINSEELLQLQGLQSEFENEFGKKNYLLLPSSGSSRGGNESVKLIALRIDRILNSANRVNHYLCSTPDEGWGLALPEFHIAGIGVLARAYLLQSSVHKLSGKLNTFAQEILQNDIQYISLVPTQIYDLIKNKTQCPDCVKKVFVGGGALAPNLKNQICELGWPIAETYGMTETASMIAVREKDEDLFRLFQNVLVKADESGRLAIHCDSLLTASLQQRDGKTHIDYYDGKSWFFSEDRAEVIRMKSDVFLKILGRSSDYLKILGEGVSLIELKFELSKVCQSIGLSEFKYELLALENDRIGYELLLVIEDEVEKITADNLMLEFNMRCRPYEKIKKVVHIDNIPRTDLGKVLLQELKEKVNSILNSEVAHGKVK
jgi:O-succinylbenzoic acid--CoA ligase